MKNSFWVCFVLLIFSSGCVAQSIVESLPGYPGKLPFKLETGYVSVGELDEVQLFYYFIESERNPVRDPLLLWLTGGPGCSGFSGLAFEVGPLLYDYKAFNGSLPSFVDNQYSWTQIANMIFLDAPVGTGFSYSTTQKGWHSSDTLSTKAIYEFLRKWILEHPRFSNNPLYITGDSYSGMIVPMVTYEIAKGNRARKHPMLNLQGYTLGNPVTDLHNDENSRVKYFYRVGLISTELYESVKRSCQGEYISPNIQDPQCFNDIAQIAMNSDYVLSYIWANDQSVQRALYVRNGTIIDWKRCNKTLDYDSDILSTVYYHRTLMAMGYRALIYSGDHDMMIPYTGTLSWIKTLNLSTIDGWRPWFVEGQIAGFTMKLSEAATIGDGLVFATVKGGGHTAPEYKPKECFQMADRWLSYYFL
ncbi:hypothetical protein Pint_11775 [Pistacia integerrima]|uniref:Uncharacterized protein n=1 Tax=Pistacia integerrima TaxID=434235 RepID=A0ACC0XNP7_9ROSI|nr:hypothetical protein Pint_11775 [Pistacia integerrima]